MRFLRKRKDYFNGQMTATCHSGGSEFCPITDRCFQRTKEVCKRAFSELLEIVLLFQRKNLRPIGFTTY